MTAKEYGWEVGMEVFVVRELNRRTPETSTQKITKVGRRWVSFGDGWNGGKFDAETLRLDGGNYSSPGRVYTSEAEYIEHTERNKIWAEFIRSSPYQAPAHISLDRLKAIIAEITDPEEGL